MRFLAPAVTLAATAAVITRMALQTRDPAALGPIPDAPSYAYGAMEIRAGNWLTIPWVGEYYQPATPGGMWPSRYPPGFSAVLAPFAADLDGVLWGSFVIAALFVVAIAVVGWRLGGWWTAAVAVALVGVSPMVYAASTFVMADVFGALLAVVVFGLFLEAERRAGWRRTALLAGMGALIGYAVFSRLALAVLGIAIAIALRNLRAIAIVAAAALPGVLALGLFQWGTFGSPFVTGYEYWLPGREQFGLGFWNAWDLQSDGGSLYPDVFDGRLLAWTCPCDASGGDVLAHTPPIITYPAALLGLYWVFIPPLAIIPAGYALWTRRRERSAQFAAIFTVLTVGMLLFYFFPSLRFLFPPGALVALYAAAGLVMIARRLRARLTERVGSRTP